MTTPKPPTAKQLRILRALALERGESFATPQTRAQASREIGRLKARRRSTRTDRAIDRREVSRAWPRAATTRGCDAAKSPAASATWRRKEAQ
jgi:hypothetical protein